MNQATVFIVEDDEELIRLLQIRIESRGHRVVTTTNGDKACDLIQAELPDLVILDVFLPDMDGLTILKRLKSPIDIETGKLSSTKDIPVVVITGKAPMIENMTRIEGAADFFVKPVDVEKLVERVDQLLKTARHAKTGSTSSDFPLTLPSPPRGEGREILLVDDDPDYSELTRTRLESSGYQVSCASNGKEAVEFLKKDHRPNLIIMDIDMPDKNGLATLISINVGEQIKGKDQTPRIPVIVATGLQGEKVRQVIMAQRVQGYLKKPYGSEELIDTVKKLIG